MLSRSAACPPPRRHARIAPAQAQSRTTGSVLASITKSTPGRMLRVVSESLVAPCARNVHREGGPVCLRRGKLNVAAVRDGDGSRDVQTEPEASGCTSGALVDAVHRIEDVTMLCRRDWRTGIPHF